MRPYFFYFSHNLQIEDPNLIYKESKLAFETENK